MEVKIWPRKKEDKGGIACMPMKKNIPEGKQGWNLTTCPRCGRECWETPLFKMVKAQGTIGMCTECALKTGREESRGRYQI